MVALLDLDDPPSAARSRIAELADPLDDGEAGDDVAEERVVGRQPRVGGR